VSTWWFRKRKEAGATWTLFFCADIHGSEVCFRKFINAAKFYSADILVMGGDITGKTIVPLVQGTGGIYTAELMGKAMALRSQDDIAQFERKVSSMGNYPYRITQDEMKVFVDRPEEVQTVLRRLQVERLGRWVEFADERLGKVGVPCFMIPGNWDNPMVDPILASAKYIKNADGLKITLPDGYEMINVGGSNTTPWHTSREYSEEVLARKVRDLANEVKDTNRCIFNLHVPPFDTYIDEAPELTEDLTVVPESTKPVGSTAVRTCIEEYQPLLSLHGHVHEGRGVFRLGRCLCLNPGSEYAEGILRGALIRVGRNKLESFQFTAG
jgi:Icc-related predicted phosphoesterase